MIIIPIIILELVGFLVALWGYRYANKTRTKYSRSIGAWKAFAVYTFIILTIAVCLQSFPD